MNITCIIGNGFDLNLGLKTSYKDFYEYYERTNSPNDDVRKMKESIKANINYWSDLELALGRYTAKVSDPKTMISIFEDLVNNLNNYLLGVDKLIPPTNEKIKSFFLQDIAKPESYLERTDWEKMHFFYTSNAFQGDTEINIITLNYTQSIEKLLDYQNDKPIKVPFPCFNGRQTNLKNIYHLHHALNDTILLGVNDETQIVNEAFRKDQTLRELLIKPEANQSLKTGVDNDCTNIIQRTNLFILFGASLGATDKRWWQLISGQLKGNTRMLLFEYDKDFKEKRELGLEERTVKNKFLSLCNFPDDFKQIIRDHIFVPVNKGIFSNIKSLLSSSKAVQTR
jgi:hypothetical protein